MDTEIVIDAKWHAERVARIQHWIEFTQEQIDWYKSGLTDQEEQLVKEKKWLAEALADQEGFEKRGA